MVNPLLCSLYWHFSYTFSVFKAILSHSILTMCVGHRMDVSPGKTAYILHPTAPVTLSKWSYFSCIISKMRQVLFKSDVYQTNLFFYPVFKSFWNFTPSRLGKAIFKFKVQMLLLFSLHLFQEDCVFCCFCSGESCLILPHPNCYYEERFGAFMSWWAHSLFSPTAQRRTHIQQAATPTESNKRQCFYLSFHISLPSVCLYFLCVFCTAGDMSGDVWHVKKGFWDVRWKRGNGKKERKCDGRSGGDQRRWKGLREEGKAGGGGEVMEQEGGEGMLWMLMSIWPQRHAAYVPRQPAHACICQAPQRLDTMLAGSVVAHRPGHGRSCPLMIRGRGGRVTRQRKLQARCHVV